MKFWTKLRGLFGRNRLERQMAEEMQAHLDRLAERNVAKGMSPEEARYAARRSFGGIEQIKERARDERVWRWLEEAGQDLKYGVRSLRRAPGFTLAALAIIGIGVGANTAIFSFVDGVLLKPMPYPETERIVYLAEKPPGGGWNMVSPPNFRDWAQQGSAFECMAAMTMAEVAMTGGEMPVRMLEEKVSAQYFDIFRIKPALGRAFAEGEDQAGRDNVVVLTNKIWLAKLGGDPAIIGRAILLEGKPHTVIGVMPPGVLDREWPEIYRPLAFTAEMMKRENRGMGAVRVFALLKPGVTPDQARTQLDVVAENLARAYPASNKGWGVNLTRYERTVISGDLRQSLTLLMGAVGLVLLIACANLANLTLARGLVREREVAIRAALGAGRARLVRQFLTESLLLSFAGGALGLAVAYGFVALLRQSPPGGAVPPTATVAIDGRVMLFTLGISLLTGVVFGLFPAIRASRLGLVQVIKEGNSAGGSGRSLHWLRGALIVTEVALAFVLLSAAGLLIRSFFQLQRIDPGFDARNLAVAYLPVADKRFASGAELNLYLHELVEHVRAVPGVSDVALTTAPPVNWGWGGWVQFGIAGEKAGDPTHRPGCGFKVVTASYFHTMGLRLTQGRFLNVRDVAGAPAAAVISESLAKKYFPDRNPIGQHLLVPDQGFATATPGAEIPWEVVGVVREEKNGRPRDEVYPGMYVTQEQSPTPWRFLMVRGEIQPAVLERALRKALHEVNGDQVMDVLVTMEQTWANSMRSEQRSSGLLAIFAAAALLLAATGLYGVISYSVAQRTREIGIRTALGATSANIRRLILHGGARLTVIGLVVGLAGAIGMAQLLAAMLYNIGKYDPATLAATGALLAITALLACWLPARRAAKVDPIVALRTE